MSHSVKPVACGLKPSRTTRAIVVICLLAGTLSTGCVTALVAVGVTAVGIGAAALAFECDEPVSVSVWDPGTAHVVCDAVVTATSGSNAVEFAPCYTAVLGDGTWTVTAVKPGRPPATGTITVDRERRCREPNYHTLELTLSSGAPSTAPVSAPTGTTAPAAAQTPPAAAPMPAAAPTTAPAPMPSEAPPVPATAPPAPSAR